MSSIAANGGFEPYLSVVAPTVLASGAGNGSASVQASGVPAVPTRAQAFSAFAGAIGAALGTAQPADAAATASAPAWQAAQAIADALGVDGTGGGGLATVLRTVQGALADAGSALQHAGVTGTQVGNLTADFERQLGSTLEQFAAALGAGSGTAATATSRSPAAASSAAAQYQLIAGEGLKLTTAGGTTVTVRLRAQASAVSGATQSTATLAGATGAAAYTQVGSYNAGRFSVKVQGNLGSDEVATLNGALGAVDTLANEFFSGDVSPAFASAASLGVDPGKIATAAVSLSQTLAASEGFTSGASAAPVAAAPTVVGANPARSLAAVLSAMGLSPPFDAMLEYLQQVLAAAGTGAAGAALSVPPAATLGLLSSAVGSASLTPAEVAGAGVLGGVLSALAGTPGAAPAAA
jgi:hypothetical protein